MIQQLILAVVMGLIYFFVIKCIRNMRVGVVKAKLRGGG